MQMFTFSSWKLGHHPDGGKNIIQAFISALRPYFWVYLSGPSSYFKLYFSCTLDRSSKDSSIDCYKCQRSADTEQHKDYDHLMTIKSRRDFHQNVDMTLHLQTFVLVSVLPCGGVHMFLIMIKD